MRDSAGNLVYAMEAREVAVGDEIVDGWRPGPIVQEVVTNDDGEHVLFVYEWDPDVKGATRHTSPWNRLGETVLVWAASDERKRS
jgi:hypothetical protein